MSFFPFIAALTAAAGSFALYVLIVVAAHSILLSYQRFR